MIGTREAGASIVIPVFNRVAFTRQCLDRIARHTGEIAHEVIVVDNGSTDGTQACASELAAVGQIKYVRNERNLGFARANNLGAQLAKHEHLLFLNNDTLVAPGWLGEMIALRDADPRIGIVGIKQLFPYTRSLYHCGIVFTRGPRPIHLYPYADERAPHVNKQREYQAVNGACLLISAELFAGCGGFDEEYINGYEDVDLCLAVRQRGLKVVCCTSAYIYHYAQISEGRTAEDDRNLARLVAKWRHAIRVDEDDYAREDAWELVRSTRAPAVRREPPAAASAPGRSPYWRGTRVSVVITVGERAERLSEQLQALARQTVLPDEFEALVIDSRGDAQRVVAEQDLSYAVHYQRSSADPRAGAARNDVTVHARGELVLFLGDPLPDERLLEEHLLAHAREPDAGTAVVDRPECFNPLANVTLREGIPRQSLPVVATMDAAAAVGQTSRLYAGSASFKRVFLTDGSTSATRRAAAPPGPYAIRRLIIVAATRTGMKSRLRALDALIEARLRSWKNGRWLARYLALRARLRPFVA